MLIPWLITLTIAIVALCLSAKVTDEILQLAIVLIRDRTIAGLSEFQFASITLVSASPVSFQAQLIAITKEIL